MSIETYLPFWQKLTPAQRETLSRAATTPVSYTHLDVYKRQQQPRLAVWHRFGDFAQCGLFPSLTGFHPVPQRP